MDGKGSSQGDPHHSGIYGCSLFRTQIAVCQFETNDRINARKQAKDEYQLCSSEIQL